GFFVAAEFSLVAVRRSRVSELVHIGKVNAKALQRAVDHLDSYLAATQLGITLSSLALGWIGEPALAQLVEPLLQGLPDGLATTGTHALAIAFAFAVITTLHIVLGELAPKSLALQRSEGTALWVVRPLSAFRVFLLPAIAVLNGLGNLVVRMFGLRPGGEQNMQHSPEELKLIVAASHEAGFLHETQQELAERVLTIGSRRIGDIMTPRLDIDWIDADDDPERILRTLYESPHEQLPVGRGDLDELEGVVLKKDLLHQVLDGQTLNPLAAIREPKVIHEMTLVVRVLEQFKQMPAALAILTDEYGHVEGLVTQTDLLEVVAGELDEGEDEGREIIEREDGSLLIDGLVPAHEVFQRLGLREIPTDAAYHTFAGFVLAQFERLPLPGDVLVHQGWRFRIVNMDGTRIDKLHATQTRQRSPDD